MTNETKPVVLIRRKTLLERVPFTDRHILNLEKKGLFPKRRVLGARCVAWVESEVESWIAAREQGPGANPFPHHS
ncbi:AlpA family phage regulatory protein [Comamonas sp.]|uniref:helix-turn-helix transcriptional regulator n=1 Tax=Comamonas sp. TaxID=34028 RepID=UPI0028994DEA|nr:AlpA family phage regulatory protein [Comamonas sp.]